MKKSLLCVLFLLASVSMFAQNPIFEGKNRKTRVTAESAIQIYTSNDELTDLLNDYLDEHPDFGYSIETVIVPSYDNSYIEELYSLEKNGQELPDIMVTDYAFEHEFTSGTFEEYCIPFEDLGIDEQTIKNSVAKYIYEICTNSSGKINGLSYNSNSCVFIYRRSIAKRYLGTDDPNKIAKAIGAGTGKWDAFMKVADKLAKKDIRIISSIDDLWRLYSASITTPWYTGNKLNIDPIAEEFMDMIYTLASNGAVKPVQQWSDEWFEDMQDSSNYGQCFGFFGPFWMVNYLIAPNTKSWDGDMDTFGDWAICEAPVTTYWGGTFIHVNKNVDEAKKEAIRKLIEYLALDASSDGFQTKQITSSSPNLPAITAVLKTNHEYSPVLNGQDMYEVFAKINNKARGFLPIDKQDQIEYNWLAAVKLYAFNGYSKEEAIYAFKENMSNIYGLR